MPSATSMTPMSSRKARARIFTLGRRGLRVLCLDLVVDLPRGLGDEEESAAQEDQVPPRDGMPEDGREGCGQAHDPRDREEEADADQERERQAQPARRRLL